MEGKKPSSSSSRFSTLRVFKFGAKNPPAPPPKDPVYLAARNRSLASLSPESPLSPEQYATTNASAVSLVLPSGAAPQQPPPSASGSKRGGLFKFSSTSSSSKKSINHDSPTDDENISMPWNFSHNVHVDEGFVGLPPSWTTSLQEAGFSEEEIAAIQQRKMADRPFPRSPAVAVVKPVPRSTSLPRPQGPAASRNPTHTPASSLGSSTSANSSPVPVPLVPKVYQQDSQAQKSAQKYPQPPRAYDQGRAAPPRQRAESPQATQISDGMRSYSPVSLSTTHSRNTSAYSQTQSRPPSPTSLPPVPAPLIPAIRRQSPSNSRPASPPLSRSLTPPYSPSPPISRSPSPPPVSKTAPNLAPLDLKLDLSLDLDEGADAWSDQVLSAGPWSATLAGFARSPSSANAPLTPDFVRDGETGLAYDDEEEESGPNRNTIRLSAPQRDMLRLPPSPLYDTQRSTARLSPTSPALLSPDVQDSRDRENRDSGMSDSTMLGVPHSAGIVNQANLVRRAVAATVPVAPAIKAPSASIAPASPQSSHFGSSSGSGSDSQDHLVETPVTELDEGESRKMVVGTQDDVGKPKSTGSKASARDYYREGRNYLKENGFRLDSATPERQEFEKKEKERPLVAPVVTSRNEQRAALEQRDAQRIKAFEAQSAGVQADAGDDDDDEDPEEALRRIEWEAMQKGLSRREVEEQVAQAQQQRLAGRQQQASAQLQRPTDQSRAPSEYRPAPLDGRAALMTSTTDTFGGVLDEEDDIYDDDGEDEGYEYGYEFPTEGEMDVSPDASSAGISLVLPSNHRPTIHVTTTAESPGPLTALGLAATPVTPALRYAGWVADAVAPLRGFIDEQIDPREFYTDLTEIAEGESGSVFAAALVPDAAHLKLRLPPHIQTRDLDQLAAQERVLVAIKSVTLVPGGTPKVFDVARECELLRGLWCEQLVGLDALYVDLVDDSLWIRMELMERSLADVIGLVEEGLQLQEPRVMARFANDMLLGLDYLQKHGIAHRDVRSDNLLLNSQGVLKLADFSNAWRLSEESPLATDEVGVIYWQAPEVRTGAYDPLKVDVWSVGATIWELAEATPPFADTQVPEDRWPALTQPDLYPPAFHDFLTRCSEPAASRPTPAALLQTPYLQRSCGRPVIMQLLSQCMVIEQALHG
ncbi:unnamed protein product [Mycena citricolor]|uniref:Non-specific serine/threonine protein kinase n=1 Tax=Mycena citricolor TaxID=2018698 RepID=A0AAD2JZU7_9AGAR|nr:unnamed protein product [Mycena citricolor]CAK5271800.1 unnamed protein product [Mycena citricolor]